MVLVDCLSIVLGNWIFEGADNDEISRRGQELCRALTDFLYGLFVVSNEVGQGIVSNNLMARRYRGALGRVTQKRITQAGCGPKLPQGGLLCGEWSKACCSL